MILVWRACGHAQNEPMKAIVYDRYGPPEVLHIEEVERPVPKDDELLVRVRATAVTRADCATREANRRSGLAIQLISRMVSGMRLPRQRILGLDFAGEVESVGASVKTFAVGDRIFGSTGFSFGAHAEYLTIPASGRIAPMPAGVSFEEAASLTDGGLNALWSLKQAHLRSGESVLVYGASGAIGTAGVQLAKHFGARVTGACSARNTETVRSLGADEVLDYTRGDFTRNRETYDVIFDAVGKLTFNGCKVALNPDGRYLATDGLQNVLLTPWTARFGDKKAIFKIPPRTTQQDVDFLGDLVEEGKYRAVIDRTYPMDEVVDATRYVETEHKTGNVILTITGS